MSTSILPNDIENMEKYELQKLRKLPIEGVAKRLGLKVKAHKSLCPFHNDHEPSLSFKVSKNTYRCFVCGASGGTIDLVMKYLNKDFLDACRWLADEHNVILSWGVKEVKEVKEVKPFDASRYVRFFEHPWLIGEARKFLFEERKLDERVVRWCRLTSYKDRDGVPWLTIPYFDREGMLIGVQNRNLLKGAKPRFRFPREAETFLYNQPVLNRLQPGDTLFISEGPSDAWSLLSAGHKAVAIPSATLLNPKATKLLKALDDELNIRFEMWPDNNEPGERLFQQLQEVLPGIVHHQLPSGCGDYSEYYLSIRG